MAGFKSSSTIKPARPTPSHQLWLSDMDQIMSTTQLPTVYFYRPINAAVPFFSAELMKNSLSEALVKYYPLAGRLIPGPDGRLELDCNAMGVQFVEAESDDEIDGFGDFTPGSELQDLVPSIDHSVHISERPLLRVQLTFFRCGGVCLGIGITHTVLDGIPALKFVSAWASVARGDGMPSEEPFFDRTLLRARDPPVPAFKHKEFDPPPLLKGHDNAHEIRSKETTVRLLKLKRDQVGMIRKQAPGCSRYEAVAGHMWRAACKARGLECDQRTKAYVPVNGRPRFQPPLPNGYFGNAIFVAAPEGRSGDIVSNPPSYTASLVKESVTMMNGVYLRSEIDFLGSHKDLSPFRRASHAVGNRDGNFYGCPNVNITSWIGIGMYDADFGWGLPLHMGPANLGYDGKMYIMETPEGDGSLLIAIRLVADHMEAFQDYFYEGLLKTAP